MGTTRIFTGWHMTAIMVAFFAVVIAVNFVMASYAVGTFGGTVVDNSYVASQQFNSWLADARAQRRLGWSADVTVEQGQLVVFARARGVPLAHAKVRVVASHPLGRVPERTLTLLPAGPGRFAAARKLPAGRWMLKIEVSDRGDDARFEDEVRL